MARLICNFLLFQSVFTKFPGALIRVAATVVAVLGVVTAMSAAGEGQAKPAATSADVDHFPVPNTARMALARVLSRYRIVGWPASSKKRLAYAPTTPMSVTVETAKPAPSDRA